MPDALRLALGTLTRFPVPPPRRVDPGTARGAMLLAPLVGLVLAVVVGVPAALLADRTAAGALLPAALAVAVLAWLTRALHLDGLADTADALGSGRPAAEALAIARRSDIGPFGVVTLVLVLLVEVVALAALLAVGTGATGLAVALVTGRLAITAACARGIRAARADGLGATVAGTVPRSAVAAEAAAWLALAAVIGGLRGGPGATAATLAAMAGGLVVGALLVRTAGRRLGGITGDVLGATTELATATTMVILVVLPG
jgi:adenosylcobinamide-GDP ribazoletransferase